MTWTPGEVSYYVLAPVSVLAGLSFLALFLCRRDLRKSPNDLVIGQIVAQTVFDAHWLTANYQHKYPTGACEVIASVALYAYLMAFMYTAAMSFVLVRCLRSHIREKEYKQTNYWYHVVCHLPSVIYVLALALLPLSSGIPAGLGPSIMKTCSLKSREWSE